MFSHFYSSFAFFSFTLDTCLGFQLNNHQRAVSSYRVCRKRKRNFIHLRDDLYIITSITPGIAWNNAYAIIDQNDVRSFSSLRLIHRNKLAPPAELLETENQPLYSRNQWRRVIQ